MKTEEKTELVILDRAHLEVAAWDILNQQAELNGVKASRDEAVTAAKAKYSTRISELEASIDLKTAAVAAWCARNEAVEFKESRTIAFPNAAVQYKINPFAVKEVEGWTWKRVVGALLKWKTYGKRYLRFADPEIDKREVLKDREEWSASEWAKRGILFEQGRSVIISAPV